MIEAADKFRFNHFFGGHCEINEQPLVVRNRVNEIGRFPDVRLRCLKKCENLFNPSEVSWDESLKNY